MITTNQINFKLKQTTRRWYVHHMMASVVKSSHVKPSTWYERSQFHEHTELYGSISATAAVMASTASSAKASAVFALFEAACSGNKDSFEIALRPFQPDEVLAVRDSDGRSLLHMASIGGDPAICQQLIDSYGLDVNLADGAGTPLCLMVG
jgi:hypothetical protein